jgi:hypothetical protein
VIGDAVPASGGSASAKRGSFSQLNTWFALTSYRRATCETDTPRTRVCAQIIRFSSSLQFRRLLRFTTKRSPNVHLINNGHYLSLPFKGRAGSPGAYIEWDPPVCLKVCVVCWDVAIVSVSYRLGDILPVGVRNVVIVVRVMG